MLGEAKAKGVFAVLTVLSIACASQDAIQQFQEMLKANPNSSAAHYGIAEIRLQNRSFQAAANEYRSALAGDIKPKWTKVWSYIGLGKVFDATGQRERAINEYNQAIQTNDDTNDAPKEAAKYLKSPYVP